MPGRQIDTRLSLAALRAAINTRHPPPGLIHQSDRGAQYAAHPYRSELAAHGLVGSMGRRGNPYDNGKAESFMKTLKCEEVVCCESFIGDGEWPPESACRGRLQTATSCEGKEPWW